MNNHVNINIHQGQSARKSRMTEVIDRVEGTYKKYRSSSEASREIGMVFNPADNPRYKVKETLNGRFAIRVEGRDNIYFERELQAFVSKGGVDSTMVKKHVKEDEPTYNEGNLKIELAIEEREEKIRVLHKEIQGLRIAEEILRK